MSEYRMGFVMHAPRTGDLAMSLLEDRMRIGKNDGKPRMIVIDDPLAKSDCKWETLESLRGWTSTAASRSHGVSVQTIDGVDWYVPDTQPAPLV